MINGYWLGLAFVPSGSKVQRKSNPSIAVRFDSKSIRPLSSSLCYRFLVILAGLIWMIAVKI